MKVLYSIYLSTSILKHTHTQGGREGGRGEREGGARETLTLNKREFVCPRDI